jgi:hypothetical protein
MSRCLHPHSMHLISNRPRMAHHSALVLGLINMEVSLHRIRCQPQLRGVHQFITRTQGRLSQRPIVVKLTATLRQHKRIGADHMRTFSGSRLILDLAQIHQHQIKYTTIRFSRRLLRLQRPQACSKFYVAVRTRNHILVFLRQSLSFSLLRNLLVSINSLNPTTRKHLNYVVRF